MHVCCLYTKKPVSMSVHKPMERWAELYGNSPKQKRGWPTNMRGSPPSVASKDICIPHRGSRLYPRKLWMHFLT